MRNIGFKHKIFLIIGMALAALLALSVTNLAQIRSQIIESRRDMLATAVQSAYSMVAAYQAKAASGAMSTEDAQKAAKDALRQARYGGPEGKTEYFYIWSTTGKGVLHPIKPEWEGQEMIGKVKDGVGNDVIQQITGGIKASTNGKAYVATMFPRPGQQTPVPKLQYLIRVDGWDWIVGSGLYTDDVDTHVRQVLMIQLGLVGAVIVLVVGVGWVVTRSVLDQVGGEPSHAIAVMAEVSKGNLDAAIPKAVPGSMLDSLSQMVAALRDMLAEVHSATESIATASHEIAQGNNDLSQRTEQAAHSIQTTASSMEELTSTVSHTADATQMANQLATTATEVAERGGQVVSQVVTTMTAINHSSKKIADIIAVIDGIAFQTNILALNAAVEAARAGEQGRGFAVVAGEVRNLAQRSAQAAKEIKDLIVDSVGKVESGTRLVDEAGSTMTDIVASVQRVTDIIGEIRSATAEQRQGIGQINEAINELDQATQQNSALVEESTAAAESLRDQTVKLNHAMSRFQTR
ncbi:MAG TPA: methyl-accepting chemotaxis protein [Burkholderiaceae bacterium]|nr:methyl-accepting chemotaxis protein [Burkholderiaceae bacterium]